MNRLTDLARLAVNYWRARPQAAFRTRAALDRHHGRALAHFRQNTLARSPFYDALSRAPLSDFPIMTKPLMLSEFDRINTRGILLASAFELAERAEATRDFAPLLGDVSVGLSTGTSGRRSVFLASRAERMRWAGMMLGRMLPGELLGRHRIAFLLRANNALYESVSGRGRIAFQFFDLKEPLAALHPKIAAFAPTILIAPAQVLRELALLEDGTQTLQPKRVISVAETLFDDDRTLIEAAFARPVEQIYQATEGFLGYTCSAGRMHLNEKFLHVERDWIDDDKTRYFPIITDFSRQTQPIVRYRLDDVLADDPRPCPCGSAEHVIARIEGRADDILVFPRRDGGPAGQLMPDFVARAVAGARQQGAPDTTPVDDFRVVQTGTDALSIRLSAGNFAAARTAVRRAMVDLFEAHALILPDLTFQQMDPADFMAKRRRVQRLSTVAP